MSVFNTLPMPIFFHKIARGGTRFRDQWGSGQFGASRPGHVHSRLHQGLDITAEPGEPIRSPIDGVITREAFPYKGDNRFRGLLIEGVNEWKGIEVKIFYVQGMIQGRVDAGQIIGTAQDLSLRYRGITNHVHIEVRTSGTLVNPLEFFGMCF
ncbi:MAG TPA: M23 family metallopeptidase [Candidatus Angelobacter sp.]|nr:M23 family metallopeptidase [Candidatus Angelobacter sp.]